MFLNMIKNCTLNFNISFESARKALKQYRLILISIYQSIYCSINVTVRISFELLCYLRDW